MAVKLTVEQTKVLVKHHAAAVQFQVEVHWDADAVKEVEYSDKEVLGKMRDHLNAALDLIEEVIEKD